jgi:hypothetical protein
MGSGQAPVKKYATSSWNGSAKPGKISATVSRSTRLRMLTRNSIAALMDTQGSDSLRQGKRQPRTVGEFDEISAGLHLFS